MVYLVRYIIISNRIYGGAMMAENNYRPGDDYEYEEKYYDRRCKRYDEDKDKDKDKDKDIDKDKDRDKDKDKDKEKDKKEKTFLKELEKYVDKKVEIFCGKHVLVVVIAEVGKDFVKAIEVGTGKIIIIQAACISFVELFC